MSMSQQYPLPTVRHRCAHHGDDDDDDDALLSPGSRAWALHDPRQRARIYNRVS